MCSPKQGSKPQKKKREREKGSRKEGPKREERRYFQFMRKAKQNKKQNSNCAG